tara:strand:- start:80 stop:1012 length:933 start_codon:yes stop_codon:yes gene_type:complete
VKKLLSILVLSLLWFNTSFADYFKIGQEIENEFRFTKKISFPLEPGIWTVVRKSGWFYGPIRVRLIGIALMDNDKIVSIREFQEGVLSGSYQSELNTALYEYFYLDKYDGCYERTEYTLVKLYTKGSSTNCLTVAHMDMKKTIYTPDDPRTSINTISYRKFLKENNIKLPDIMLDSWHAYFSRTVSSNLYTVAYFDNPLYFNGPKHKFSTEDTSEYHPSNINKHPKFKKYMDEFIKISAARHMEFEKIVSAKTHHRLDFSSIGIDNKKKTKVKTLKNNDMIKQLNDLKKLLDEGVITQDEFTKAKKKILN